MAASADLHLLEDFVGPGHERRAVVVAADDDVEAERPATLGEEELRAGLAGQCPAAAGWAELAGSDPAGTARPKER